MRTNTDLAASTPAAARPTLLILLHGIRTDAEWQERLASRFTNTPGFEVVPIKYGRLDPFRFWSPFFTRKKIIEQINTRLQNTLKDFPGYRKVIIAHSFGTYALVEIMKANPLVRFDRIILCGSIVSQNFNWDDLKDQIEMPPNGHLRDYIVNECGARDIWPILAQTTTFGFGSTGTFGFGASEVRDRYHDVPHSGYFEDKFIEDYWLPFLNENRIKPSKWESNRPKTPFAHQLLRLPFKFVFPMIAGALLFGLASAAYRHFYDYSAMLGNWQECGAQIVYPTQIYRLVRSDRRTGGNMLMHRNGLARIYLNAWNTRDGLDVAATRAALRLHRTITWDPGHVEMVEGDFDDSDGVKKHFFYRFRTRSTSDNKGVIVKMFEHVYPKTSPDRDIYQNVNHIISGSFYNLGVEPDAAPNCAWPTMETLLGPTRRQAINATSMEATAR